MDPFPSVREPAPLDRAEPKVAVEPNRSFEVSHSDARVDKTDLARYAAQMSSLRSVLSRDEEIDLTDSAYRAGEANGGSRRPLASR
jgi:hypothetical protein